ncbi:hypothetical protein BM221_006465 [Beauveria bassiana]|uniref:DNA replication regulator Sld3 C-terminal domain-containing protein n=1 Tax=Beauveria bassiana TaxID=176275 RepID=A0A2N6NLY5_BEABA|nr:hypothetical protein BM221_006465 [Beauveria bassiana]
MSSSAAPDDRGASRPRSGILTPGSDGSLNHASHKAAVSTVSSPADRCRRRSDPAMERLLRPSIAVKPHPHALSVQPKTLSPLFVLRRQDLPLSCIDFGSTTAESAYTRLVESRIKVLDLETRIGAARSVLVARHEATRAVYAVERHADGLYAMCRLGAWVSVERLARDAATAVCAERVFPVKAETLSSPSIAAAAMTTTTMTTLRMDSPQRKKRAAIEAIQSLVRKKPKAEARTSSDGVPAPEVPRRSSDQMLAHVKQSVEESPMLEIMIRHVKKGEEEVPMPEIMIPHIKSARDEKTPEIMIRYVKGEDEVPMPEIMVPHIKTRPDEKTPEIMIPHVKPSPDEIQVVQSSKAKAHFPVRETQGESSAMGAVSALPSSQIHIRAIDDDTQDMATNIFENIRAHYFEALYKSMGSLAYFAKGPLSRARSAFHLDLEATLDMADLIEFLKSLVLTTVQVDKKYRETAPDIISQIAAPVDSSDEARSKKRKPKKMKLGKNGLYPDEDDRIRTWWNANKPELDEEQPTYTAMQIKSHLSLLRTRETQLQMILILEILALEPLKAADDAADSSLPLLPGASASQAHRSPAVAPAKKRNKHNLPVLIDVHADRLTIWQSTATDEQQLAEESQVNRHSLSGSLVQKSSSEPLKDFCTDVIVPFFSARIPEMCDAISRKLGGPVIVPASGSKTQKRSAPKKEQKPGSATKRPAAVQRPRTLQRALSTDQQSRRSVSRGPSNMIALLRSATSTSLPSMKREGSETANLGRLSKMEGDSQRRPALSRSNSSGVAGHDTSKASRQALVDAQVKDAIAALRKPNRQVVGQAMQEADQQRVLAAKKTRRMQRSTIVKATPANNRFRDVYAYSQSQPGLPMQHIEEAVAPSSVEAFIPSTGHRTGFRNPMDLNTSPAIDTVGSTPSKRATKSTFLHRSNDELCLPPSPLVRTSNNPTSRPLSSSLSTNKQPQLAKADEGAAKQYETRDHVFATPAKKEKHQQVLSGSPVGQLRLQGQSEPKKSIYATLGWDDDYDI